MTKELCDLAPPELGGATALYIAVQNGHADCVHQLIKAGCNVDPQTDAGSTPLMIAMYLADVSTCTCTCPCTSHAHVLHMF